MIKERRNKQYKELIQLVQDRASRIPRKRNRENYYQGNRIKIPQSSRETGVCKLEGYTSAD